MTKKAIRFTATWCGPCRAYGPTFKRVSETRNDWEFETIDIDSQSEAAEKYGIRSIPCTVLELDGNMLAKYVGVLSDSQLNANLNEWNEPKQPNENIQQTTQL
jgi:thioredoxin 1